MTMSGMQRLSVFWWLCVIISTQCQYVHGKRVENQTVEYVKGTVYVDVATGKVTYKLGEMDKKHGTAYGYYNNTLNVTGWTILEISSGVNNDRSAIKNTDFFYAVGFLEGVLTARQMWQNFVNLRDGMNAFFGKMNVTKIKEFYARQDKWTRSMIKSHPAAEDVFWRHVSYVMAQFDGLYAGYRAAAQPDWDTDEFVVQFLNGVGDYLDLKHVLDPSTRPDFRKMTAAQFREYFVSSSHCSALVKVTPGYENLFMSHSSWFIYASMMRIYKHYHFPGVTDPCTVASSLSFSSYPGFLVSLDDFYLLNSKLVILQTTNSIFNDSLYSLVGPQSLFTWQRIRVANMLAAGGETWSNSFAKYNSGTYNNQYMVIDLKAVVLSESLNDGTLWVVEQIPGLVVGDDQTDILRAGYWPSYNVPFYESIYNLSGYPEVVKTHGVDYSYQLAPRAKIFRRDQSTVVAMQTMKDMMRYNDYRHDAYSENDSCSTICCRGDISSRRRPFGCYDTKVSDYAMAASLTSDVINGPTTSHGLPAFRWSAGFNRSTHLGMPDTYDFGWVRTAPVL